MAVWSGMAFFLLCPLRLASNEPTQRAHRAGGTLKWRHRTGIPVMYTQHLYVLWLAYGFHQNEKPGPLCAADMHNFQKSPCESLFHFL